MGAPYIYDISHLRVKYERFQVSTMLIPRIWSSGMLQEDKNPQLYIYYKGLILLARNIFLITISSLIHLQPEEVLPMSYIYWQKDEIQSKTGKHFPCTEQRGKKT